MELKPYQQEVIDSLTRYLALLREGCTASKAYLQLWNEKNVPVGIGGLQSYKDSLPGTPNVCLKVPTGGGKTYIAASAIKPIFESLPFNRFKAAVWLVPSDAILEQTLKTLSDPHHPYRQKINTDFSHRVEVYSKAQLLSGQNFNPTVIREQLSIFVLSYDSFRTNRKEGRKVFQENGNLAQFARFFNDKSLLLADTDETALIQVIRHLNPVVIVDESHHASTPLSKEMLTNFNPAFVLDLTATPKNDSNIIAFVDALRLKEADMVKLPVIVYNRKTQNDVISHAIRIRNKLEKQAIREQKNSKRYIRPIVLFQAEPRGKDQNTTFDMLKQTLLKVGIPENQIAIKTADKNDLRGVDLLSKQCPIRYIITINALKEGWDCPFAYVLATIANRSSLVDVEQILGRILRLPDTKPNDSEALNISYAVTSSTDFKATLDKVVAGLHSAGFSDKEYRLDIMEEEDESTLPDSEQMPLPESAPETESGENDYEMNPEAIKLKVEQDDMDSDDADLTRDEILAPALAQAADYAKPTGQTGNPDLDTAPQEVRSTMNIFHMKEEYASEAAAIRLPQFVLPIDLPTLLPDTNQKILDKGDLTEGFILRDKDTIIDFSMVEAEIARVDIEESKEALPRAWKLKGVENQIYREWFDSLPTEGRIKQCKKTILDDLSKINAVNDKDLNDYVTRIISGLTTEQLEDLQQSPYLYSEKIKKKIKQLITEHMERKFFLWIEQGRITCEPGFRFQDSISPLKYTTTYPNSLYTAEEDMNGLEKEVVWELANMHNIKWWHRNISRTGFNINGYINAFPDIIAMTKSGKLLMIEPKGDHLENTESKDKAAVGKAWERMAGRDYRYYMVFKEKDLRDDGTVHINTFFEIVKSL